MLSPLDWLPSLNYFFLQLFFFYQASGLLNFFSRQGCSWRDKKGCSDLKKNLNVVIFLGIHYNVEMRKK